MGDKERTWYVGMCKGRRACKFPCSLAEKDEGELLHCASVVMHIQGHNCMYELLRQEGVPCENLTVALLTEEDQDDRPNEGHT